MWLILTILFGVICYWYGTKEGYADGYEDAPTVQREGWIEDLKSRMHMCCEHAADYEATEHYKEAIARVDLAFLQLAALTDKE